MKPTLVTLAIALSIATGPALAGPGLAFGADAPAPAASQAVQKYVLTVAGMT